MGRTERLDFLVATFNEETEIVDLLGSVKPYVDSMVVCDDCSTDNTVSLALGEGALTIVNDEHTGLPETVKHQGLEYIKPHSWVLMLDADERIPTDTLIELRAWVDSPESENITHVWFTLQEYINGMATRQFSKCRLFRRDQIDFSSTIHEDDTFRGQGAFFGWPVIHRKTAEKQIQREYEYINTYQKLLAQGKVTQEWVDRCISMHYFVRGAK